MISADFKVQATPRPVYASSMNLPYDPTSAIHRKHLAQRVLALLATSGFIEEAVTIRKAQIRERVFYRVVNEAPEIRVQVWTSIEGEEVRAVGEDAIRICAVYRNKQSEDKGILKNTRVHRVGDVDDICNRLLARMRETYKKARTPNRCKSCGAPTFTSKKKNEVCSDLCYINRVQETYPSP